MIQPIYTDYSNRILMPETNINNSGMLENVSAPVAPWQPSLSFTSIWGNLYTLKANGERPDGITDIEWAQYLTDQEIKRQGVTDSQDVIFNRQMNIIEQQNAIAISDATNNKKVFDDEKNAEFDQVLLQVAKQQAENPGVPFLVGTVSELTALEARAADLGITQPLVANVIDSDGSILGEPALLEPAKVQAQFSETIRLSLLNQIVNYIYKQIYKN